MPFIPHTDADLATMLKTIGAKSLDDLFDEIPAELRITGLNKQTIPQGLSELAMTQQMQSLADKNKAGCCFIGAGAYEHHIPAAVWQITSRGEFLTAYTPYQAEASQGTLQLIYEYQTMMASLMGMDVSNASLYDGASAVAEAILMAIRCHKKAKARKILMPTNLHPHYQQTVQAIVSQQNIELIEVAYQSEGGHLSLESLEPYANQDISALVINQPNFFGVLEDVDALTNWAHAHEILVIAVVNPLAMALLKEPGRWGDQGADLVCGEGQPLGVPLASGGPYFGFLCCKQEYVRQMPGRIIGRTVDLDGKTGFALTLQAREQHIRRSKATSNICTNQGLLVTAATIYMSLMGPQGLRQVAAISHSNSKHLLEKLLRIDGVEKVFARPFFHEFVIRVKKPIDEIIKLMTKDNIQAGLSLKPYYPELGDSLLVCVTETKTEDHLEQYVNAVKHIILTKPSMVVA
jgi:glycine dehydrogenase subunit 1